MQYIHIRFVEPEQKKGQDPELQHCLVLSEQIHSMRVGNCPEFATLCGIPGPMCLDYIHNTMRIGEHIALDGLLNSQQGLSGEVTNDEQGLFHGVTDAVHGHGAVVEVAEHFHLIIKLGHGDSVQDRLVNVGDGSSETFGILIGLKPDGRE